MMEGGQLPTRPPRLDPPTPQKVPSRDKQNEDTVMNSTQDPRRSDDEDAISDQEPVRLSDTLRMFPNKELSAHRNVVAGEIFSSCVIKYDRNQIVREAAALRKLRGHSHVISLFGSGTFGDEMLGFSYIVLERCHDLNLENYLLSDDIVPVYDVTLGLKFCKQIIIGMKFVHEYLIIHKDLKPSNILLTHDLENVKIADFGSSQEVTSPTSMVPNSNIFGTLGYRPPESLEPSHVSLKSDIFSLGVVFHFLLSNGKSPFGSLSDKWDHNTKIGVIDLSQLIVLNPMATQHLIKSMLNRERRSRPSLEEVERHPCWNGEENIFQFEYKFEEEVLDSEGSVVDEAPSEEKSDDSVKTFLREMLRLEALHGPFNAGSLELMKRSKKLMQNYQFPKAAKVLRELFNSTKSNKLEVSLQIVECELCSKTDKLDESVQRVRESIPKSFSANDLAEMARKLKENGHYVRALCLFCIAGEMYSKLQLSPDDAANWIGGTVDEVESTLRTMFKKSEAKEDNVSSVKLMLESDIDGKIRHIATNYSVKNMKSLLRDLQALEDVDDDVRAEQEASCYLNICLAMGNSGDHENSIRFGEEGLDRLEKEFEKNIVKSSFYGWLLMTIGYGYHVSNHYYDADRYWDRALKASEKANYENEAERQEQLVNIQNWHKDIRDEIKQKDSLLKRWFRRLFK